MSSINFEAAAVVNIAKHKLETDMMTSKREQALGKVALLVSLLLVSVLLVSLHMFSCIFTRCVMSCMNESCRRWPYLYLYTWSLYTWDLYLHTWGSRMQCKSTKCTKCSQWRQRCKCHIQQMYSRERLSKRLAPHTVGQARRWTSQHLCRGWSQDQHTPSFSSCRQAPTQFQTKQIKR